MAILAFRLWVPISYEKPKIVTNQIAERYRGRKSKLLANQNWTLKLSMVTFTSTTFKISALTQRTNQWPSTFPKGLLMRLSQSIFVSKYVMNKNSQFEQ